jgi:hypothetical protein
MARLSMTPSDVIIGISSTKQDVLARKIDFLFPNLNVYCLGAAIYTRTYSNSESVFVTYTTMFAGNPIRTLRKTGISFFSFIRTITIYRIDLLKFGDKLNKV